MSRKNARARERIARNVNDPEADSAPLLYVHRDKLWSIHDDELVLNFHEGQATVWDSEKRFVFAVAGSQGGKTSFGSWWLAREIFGGMLNGAWYMGRGSGDYLAVTSSYDLFKLKMLPALRETFEGVLGVGRYWAGDRIIEIADPTTGEFWAKRADDEMWARIILRSAQAGGGLEASTALAAWGDEIGQDEFGLEDFEAIERRLSISQGRFLGTTTPYNAGWLKTEIYDKWTRGLLDDTDIVQFPSYFNPAFPYEEYERKQKRMARWRFLMFYAGQFAKPAGLIYGDLDDSQIIDPVPIESHWRIYAGIDFGGVHTAIVWLAHDPATDTLYLFRESLDGDKSTKQHCRDFKETSRGERVVGIWGGAPSEEQWRTDWNDNGVFVERPPISDVEGGIDRVISFIKPRRLKVFNTCRLTIDQLGTYRRKLDARGEPLEEIENKRIFHMLDALRYVSSGIAESGAGAGRSAGNKYVKDSRAEQQKIIDAIASGTRRNVARDLVKLRRKRVTMRR